MEPTRSPDRPATQADEWADLIARPDPEIDLALAALQIARDEYPTLDIDAYRARLDRMAEEALPRVAIVRGNPFATIDALNGYLFDDLGFRGNQEEYFDPRNSYLSDVLDRRRGIPITLSVVYMEVGARVGFDLEGVGFPGHFLVRHASGGREVIIDPFHAGEILLPEDCRKRLASFHGAEVPLEPRYFQTASKRAILVRMLQNLKHLYLKSDDCERALRVIGRLLALAPDDPSQIRDRGLAHAGLSHHALAAADLERYLALAPAAPDAVVVRKHIRSLRRMTAMLN